MTLGLFLLRACQMGLKVADLDALEKGTVFDMMTESFNDEFKYRYVATQADFDRW